MAMAATATRAVSSHSDDIDYTSTGFDDDEQSWKQWYDGLDMYAREKLSAQMAEMPAAAPQPGPQTEAYLSEAQVVGYGGAAGGGKSALLAILALKDHERSVIFRFDKSQLTGLIDDLVRFYGSDVGLNRQVGVFRFADRNGHMVEFGGLGSPGDENKWQGRAHDLMALDEVTEIPRSKVEYLKTWNRSATKGQRCRIIMTFNPPGSPGDESGAAGRWIIDYFAPWLDERHPNPAKAGEIRWFGKDADGNDVELKPPDRRSGFAGDPGYDGSPYTIEVQDHVLEVVPESRTFIPARVWDNKYLMQDRQYVSRLNSLEPVYRAKMLEGDFRTGLVDAEMQVIPSEWLEAAMDRYDEVVGPGYDFGHMDALGIDVARGGRAYTVWSPRHGFIWPKMKRKEGIKTKDGASVGTVALEMVAHKGAPMIAVDANGSGASAYDWLNPMWPNVVDVYPQGKIRDLRRFLFPRKILNMRAALLFVLRKILDPAYGFEPMIYRDNRVRAELLAIRYRERAGKVLLEEKDETKLRVGFTLDEADALIFSLRNIGAHPEAYRLLPGASRKVAERRQAAATPTGGRAGNRDWMSF